MSAITYGSPHTTSAGKRTSRPLGQRKGLWARFMEARQRQAFQELQRHGLRLPRELEEAGLKISARNEDSLPFMR